jgi:hypothetical protein
MDDIINKIPLRKNTAMIKYSSELGGVKEAIYIDDYVRLFKFITKNNFFSNLLFMSSTVINRSLFIKYYAQAFDCTTFPHLYPIFLLLYHKEANILMSEKCVCVWGFPEPRYHWFFGTTYYKMLHWFSAIPFVSKKDLRIISKKWLNIKLRNIFLSSVIMLTHNIDKKIAIKIFKDYYRYVFSFIEKIFFGPIYLIIIVLLSNYLLLNWLMKYYKNYESVKNMTVNF